MAVDFPLGLAALRFTVNLARLTKTRGCTSCFGSTISGMRLFTKTWLRSCFGSTSGHLACFNFRTALQVTCCLCFPLIPSFHLPRAPRLPCRPTLAQLWTTLIRCASPMGPISRLSHPFHLPVPPSFLVRNLLLPRFCCLNLFVYCKFWPVRATLLVTFV